MLAQFKEKPYLCIRNKNKEQTKPKKWGQHLKHCTRTMETYTFINGAEMKESEIMEIINRCLKATEYDPEKEAKKKAKREAKRAQLEEDFQECVKFCKRVVMI